jgi:hypothetical protein
MFSPRWLFLYPGLALIVLGSIGTALLFFGRIMITAQFGLDEHTFLVSAIGILVGRSPVSCPPLRSSAA